MNRNQIRMLAAEHPVGHPHRGPAFGERCDPVSLFAAAAPALIGGLGAAVISGAFSGDKNVRDQAPVVAAPTVMPTPDDAAMKAAQRKQQMALQARRGRESTILDNGTSGDLLGA